MKSKLPTNGAIQVNDLKQLTSAPPVKVVTDNGELLFSRRRLTPAERAEIERLMEAALPPQKPPDEKDKSDEPRYDFADPAYQKKKRSNLDQARAMALCLAYDVFRTEWNKTVTSGARDQVEWLHAQQIDDGLLETLFRYAHTPAVFLNEEQRKALGFS